MRNRLYATLIQFLFVPLSLKAQIITTIAGNGSVSNTGDGGVAINASIDYPVGGVFDKNGNYYFATGIGGHSVRKISTAGIITTVAGNGAAGYSGDAGLATSAELNNPQAVIVDSLGNLFIADASNNCIRRVDISTGIINTIAGTGTPGYSGDGGQAISAQLYDPLDLCFDKFGNLIIADFVNSRLRKISALGVISTIAGIGTPGHSGNGGPATSAEITPFGISIDDTGNVYIADIYSVRKILTNGNIVGFAGNGIAGYSGDGGAAIAAQVTATKVHYDKINRETFLTDHNDNRVRKVSSGGIITKIAGTGTAGFSGDGGDATLAQLYGTFGITTDSCSNLYIADGNNRRIRKVSFNPNCWPTNVNEAKPVTFNLYPNPAGDKITIISQNKLAEATVINAIGKQVLKQGINKEKAELNIAHLPAGIYFIIVQDIQGASLTKKMIKE